MSEHKMIANRGDGFMLFRIEDAGGGMLYQADFRADQTDLTYEGLNAVEKSGKLAYLVFSESEIDGWFNDKCPSGYLEELKGTILEKVVDAWRDGYVALHKNID